MIVSDDLSSFPTLGHGLRFSVKYARAFEKFKQLTVPSFCHLEH
jgi:hypothetical protein